VVLVLFVVFLPKGIAGLTSRLLHRFRLQPTDRNPASDKT
jgi:hypothetical protein